MKSSLRNEEILGKWAFQVSRKSLNPLRRNRFAVRYFPFFQLSLLQFFQFLYKTQKTRYAAYSFQKLLRERGVTQSFSKSGTSHDNAVAEAFFFALKKEDL